MKRKGSSSCLDLSEKQCTDNNTLCYWVTGHGKQVGHCRSKPKRKPKATPARSRSRDRRTSAGSRSREASRSKSRSASRSAGRSRSKSREVPAIMHVPLFVAVSTVLAPDDFRLTASQGHRIADHVMDLFQMGTQFAHMYQWLFFTKLHENAFFQFRAGRRRRPVLEFDLQMPASLFANKQEFLNSTAAADFVKFMKNTENPDTLSLDYITGFMRDAERKYGDQDALAPGVHVAFDYRLGSPIV